MHPSNVVLKSINAYIHSLLTVSGRSCKVADEERTILLVCYSPLRYSSSPFRECDITRLTMYYVDLIATSPTAYHSSNNGCSQVLPMDEREVSGDFAADSGESNPRIRLPVP